MTPEIAIPAKTLKPSSVLKGAALALITSTALGFATPALALDATDFFKALQTEAAKEGNTVTFESLEASGSDGAIATGIKIINAKKGDQVTIGEMILSGTEVLGNDGFSFETMEASDFKLTPKPKDGQTTILTFGSITAEDFRVLPAENRKNPFWPMNLGNARIERIGIVTAGKSSVSLNIPSFAISGLEHDDDGVSFTLDEAILAAGTGSFASENGGSGEFSTGEMEISDAARLGQSGLSVDVFSFDGVRANGTDKDGKSISFAFGGMNGTDIFSPDYANTDSPLFPEEEARAEIGSMSLSIDGKEVFSMAGGISAARHDADTNEYGFDMAFSDLYLDVKSMPANPKNAQNLQKFYDLGYEDITLDITATGNWNVATGVLNLQSYKFDAENMAAFDMALKLDGYTVEFAKKLQQITAKINDTDDPQLQQAMSMQLLAEMSALSVSEIQLKLEDESLTRRIMQAQAKQSGQTADDMAAALPFMAGAMLAQLDIPEFAASVSGAFGAYFTSALNNEGSLTIKASPQEPVSFAEIMGIAAGVRAGNVKPAEVIERLNLTISGE